jgi:hypothetical protein
VRRFLILALFAGCSGVANLGDAPASLRVLAPAIGSLTVTVHSAYGDTTVTAPACVRWAELYVAPTLDARFFPVGDMPLERRYLMSGPPLWPGELPNAVAGMSEDLAWFVVAAATGQPRC